MTQPVLHVESRNRFDPRNVGLNRKADRIIDRAGQSRQRTDFGFNYVPLSEWRDELATVDRTKEIARRVRWGQRIFAHTHQEVRPAAVRRQSLACAIKCAHLARQSHLLLSQTLRLDAVSAFAAACLRFRRSIHLKPEDGIK